LVEVELFVLEEPSLVAVEVVEDWVLALLDPLGSVPAVEPFEVVVPAVPPEPACEVPPAEVVVEAVPVPVGVGVGVGVPVGLLELD
jgi:hypothetical protein